MSIGKELEKLNQLILRMADLVEDNLKKAFHVYLNYNANSEYNEINDDIINARERIIEEECLKIMLKERPYSKDLRRVSGILKLVEDLERLGDHAEDIMHFSLKLKKLEQYKIVEIEDLITNVLIMVHDAIQSFITSNVQLSQNIIRSDDLIDAKFDEIIDKVINLGSNQTISIEFAIYTTLVVKYLERIADHAVNIAEWVVYIESGYYKDKQIF